MLLIIDNYDSFTYNIVQYFQCLKQKVIVYLSDKITIMDIKKISPKYIVISPGPNSPKESGISIAVIRNFYKYIPILGICLGHQCIAYAFGSSIISYYKIMHGKISYIVNNGKRLFYSLPQSFKVARYHSLIIQENTLPKCFSIDAYIIDNKHNIIMAISHNKYPLYGIQFHPESIISEYGLELLHNFIKQK